MKTQFSTFDIRAIIDEIHNLIKGSRVYQIYDIDNKTYLFRLKDASKEKEQEHIKRLLLIQSGVRIHTSEYEWPKNSTVSGFTMKLRKHLKNKRIEYVKQIGLDRIVDIQIGTNEAAYHVIIELYDKGNIILTDYNYVILNLLKARRSKQNEDVKFLVKEIYPILRENSTHSRVLSKSQIEELISSSKPGDNLRRIFTPHVIFGPALLEHAFIDVGFDENYRLNADKNVDIDKLFQAISKCNDIMNTIDKNAKGFIIQKEEKRISDQSNEKIMTYHEFHPYLFNQHKSSTKYSIIEFESFNKAVDIFFSSIIGQKIDQKAIQQEKDALKKLENVRKDHEKRLQELAQIQQEDIKKAELIEKNVDLVDKALLIMRSAIANQINWEEIKVLIKEAQLQGNPIASSIKQLKLDKNQFTMLLKDPFDEDKNNNEPVDIDLDLSAYANVRKYYDLRRIAARKEQKTIESSGKALKSAGQKTQQALKDVAIKASISKARKVLWFEKFYWAISSENYLIIGGRDAHQNDLIVKRYLKKGDIYVHADLHGATSVVVKNHKPSEPIPPKTLEQAGVMAVCYSSAWDDKFSCRSWWVYHDQVSKTAPTGEYLNVGAFMIRGKKNFLSVLQQVMGFGFMFRLDEESTERHKNDRKIKMKVIEYKDDDENEINLKLESEEESEFPDVKLKVMSTASYEEDRIEITGSQSIKKKMIQIKKKKDTKDAKNKIKNESNTKPQITDQSNQLKRGQRSKLKKIKKKYKDQDEYERQMKMAILGSNLSKKRIEEKEITKEDKENETENEDSKSIMENSSIAIGNRLDNIAIDTSEEVKNDLEPKDNEEITEDIDDEDGEDDEQITEEKLIEQQKILNSLTGQPLNEDNLLYAIPVVAPYSIVTNYKYKVKVLPGTGKRGKAAKTALQLFLNDKACTPREKDLLKSTKDQDIARNLPDKVKVSAVNLSSSKTKK